MLNSIKKEEKLIISFYTTMQAIALEQLCIEKNMPGRLIPIPKTISAGCGLAYSIDIIKEEEIKQLLIDNDIEYQNIHYCFI